MSKKNNFGRAIYDIFGVGKDDSEDELGGEAESSDFFPVREETSDFVPPPGPGARGAAAEAGVRPTPASSTPGVGPGGVRLVDAHAGRLPG